MNLPNKITLGRIILSIIILIIMMFPFHDVGYDFPTYLVAGRVTVNLKYIICGILFMIASFTDFLDGNIARKRNIVTDLGKVMDAIADKILVNVLETSIDGATDAIINVTGGKNLSLFEVEDAVEVVRASANTDINIIFGAVVNENLEDEVIVTVIATGFEEEADTKTPNYIDDEFEEKEEDQVPSKPMSIIDEEYDIPPFLRDRDNF